MTVSLLRKEFPINTVTRLAHFRARRAKQIQPHFKQPEDLLQAGNLSVSDNIYE